MVSSPATGNGQMVEDLIYDIGMHTGKDTAYYLKKGFRVVAVEANSELVRGVSERFATEIAADRLRIFNVAISEVAGPTTFFINEQKDEWGTLSREFVERNEALGTTHRAIEVPGVPLGEIIAECGIPYYAKVDIEGADLLCLRAFHDFHEKPPYISIESSLVDYDSAFSEFAQMWILGYREFKIVNQALNHRVVCPDPALEGCYVDQEFDGEMSGPFGEEAPGEWQGMDATLKRYKKILADTARFGAMGKYYRSRIRVLDGWFRKLTNKEPTGWYDTHAKLRY
jgi:FkbM family methyltransferase